MATLTSAATLTVPSNRPSRYFDSVASPSHGCVASSPKVFRTSRRTESFYFLTSEKLSTTRICSAVSEKQTHLQSYEALWEDPHDDSGSEYDDQEDERREQGDDMDFESDWGEEKDDLNTPTGSSTLAKSEEDLIKEVVQLLGPEERAIFQENSFPNLGKISTAKWSPLHSFALSWEIKCMDKLLENGLDIDYVDKNGYTALHMAVIGKKEAVIIHLLRKGANPNARDPDGATPLHYAIQVGSLHMVKLLIKYNVDVNAADDDGWTPLHIAIQSRNRDIAKLLLVNNADKTRKNTGGKTALDLSLCFGKDFKSYDLAKLLKTVLADRKF